MILFSDELVCIVTWRCMSVTALIFLVRIVLVFCWEYWSEDIAIIGLIVVWGSVWGGRLCLKCDECG